MKFIYLNLIFILSSCCLGNRKCPETNLSASFRILSSINNQDLVFGPNRLYDKMAIKFYSLNGSDTILHHCIAGIYSDNLQDSLLFVEFAYSKEATVYVKLNSADTDTLQVVYKTNTSQCCEEYSIIDAFNYNNTTAFADGKGIIILQK